MWKMERELVDKTKSERDKLTKRLSDLAVNDEERSAIRSFGRGVFMVPSRTIQVVHELIERSDDKEELLKIYNSILERGL
ncbi:MAG: hypothetical protein A2659_04460 [Candidatus Yanofskybacteria bacterium RIFCSPHIGHO2_01_FULL_44_24]|nr:MAG: hypothetical protein A2659_04460 [Candidatus Yanofskybacteria bacterium RIFCSPHIGHO2_01_FULL_44_24]